MGWGLFEEMGCSGRFDSSPLPSQKRETRADMARKKTRNVYRNT
jgi:hypothetical protein